MKLPEFTEGLGRLNRAIVIVRHAGMIAVKHVLDGSFPDVRDPAQRSCLRCAGSMEETVVERQIEEEVRRGVCKACGWVDWDPPVPVVSGLVVFPKKYVGGTDVEGPFDFAPEDYENPGQTGVAVIKRGIPPFKGEWALPGGYVMRGITPKRALEAEIAQEIGVSAELERFLHPCNPAPGKLNQIVQHGLARPLDGKLQAGDDAEEVNIVGAENFPELCFSSHRKTVRDYFEGKNGRILGRKQYP